MILTDADLEVLTLAAQGLSTIEIGKKLNRSPETIKSRKKRIMRGLQAKNMSEAIYKAVNEITQYQGRSA